MKCLVCGRKLRATFLTERGLAVRLNRYDRLIRLNPGSYWQRAKVETQRRYEAYKGMLGLNGRGHFCTNRCAVAFAEAHVDALQIRRKIFS